MKTTNRYICITQPEHLPWLGHFDKLLHADFVVFLDNVQYKRRHFENRNRIYTPHGVRWLTVPVQQKGRFHQTICSVEILPRNYWQRSYLGTLKFGYQHAPYFEDYYPGLAAILQTSFSNLADLNIQLIEYLAACLKIPLQYCRASTLPVAGQGSHLILNILQYLGNRSYFSGRSGALDTQLLTDNGIEVKLQDFVHPIYNQLYQPFVSNLSIVDLLFMYGPNSREIVCRNE